MVETKLINRELSLLEFNRRVLAQATDDSIPPIERLFYLTICSSNLDEFFEIRVAGLKQQVVLGISNAQVDGFTPQETLKTISRVAHELVAAQYECLNKKILPLLASHNIVIHETKELPTEAHAWMRRYFLSEVLPALTPLGLDPAHPFPKISNKSLNFIVELTGNDAFDRSVQYGVVKAPRTLPRVIKIPSKVINEAPGTHFILLASIIQDHIGELFPGMEAATCNQFRVTRNSELWIDEDEADDLLNAVAGELPRRNYGSAVRLEVSRSTPKATTEFLANHFKLQKDDLYIVDGPVNLGRLSQILRLVEHSSLRFPPFLPHISTSLKERSPFDILNEEDILLHHPYQSFAPIQELLFLAARDPQVLAIKMTLYRTASDSVIIKALLEAARSGKEVSVVIELRARFDEEANIGLATKLQEAGANVIYGVVGFKTHAKLLLIVRREGRKLKRYAHLGTGNYHAGTARSYTDIGYLTSDNDICEDVHKVFHQLTGFGKAPRLKKLIIAPFKMRHRILEFIKREIVHAKSGKKARIILKMNSLSERNLIEALYEASQAGVKINLIIRGICCLRPGVPGLSSNINVRSIIGRFLEHSRVFYFENDGDDIVYCSSADIMTRNLYRRVEVAFPVTDPKLKERVIRETLNVSLRDNSNAWKLESDGTYKRVTPSKGALPFFSQTKLIEQYSPGSK